MLSSPASDADVRRPGAVVTARMTSSRLPGKPLRPLAGKPALGYLLERLEHAPSLAGVVVATSTEPTDDAIAGFCARRGVAVYRGPLDDVATRFLGAADANGFDPAVRVTGDSVLHDPAIVERGVELYDDDVDLVTNTHPRSFPIGQSVEVIRPDALRTAVSEMTDAADREHVARFLYRHPSRFCIRNFTADEDRSVESVALDTAADFALLERVVRAMDRPQWEYGWREVAELCRAERAGTGAA